MNIPVNAKVRVVKSAGQSVETGMSATYRGMTSDGKKAFVTYDKGKSEAVEIGRIVLQEDK